MDPVSGGESIKTLIFCWNGVQRIRSMLISHFGLFHSPFLFLFTFLMKLPTFLWLLFYLLHLDPFPTLCVFVHMMKRRPWTWSKDLKVLYKILSHHWVSLSCNARQTSPEDPTSAIINHICWWCQERWSCTQKGAVMSFFFASVLSVDVCATHGEFCLTALSLQAKAFQQQCDIKEHAGPAGKKHAADLYQIRDKRDLF